MGRIIAVCMNKGGVGKTTLVTHLGAAIAAAYPGKRVLIVDADAQGNSSTVFGIEPERLPNTLSEALLGSCSIQKTIVPITEQVHLIAADYRLNEVELHVLAHGDLYEEPLNFLGTALAPLTDAYDYVILDCPPSLGLMTNNALFAATDLLLPFVPEAFAVKGLQRIVHTMEQMGKVRKTPPAIFGVVSMMVDTRSQLHQHLLQEARQFCQSRGFTMFDAIIPRSIYFANAAAYEGKPAVWLSRSHPAAAAYFELAKEVVEHAEKEKGTACSL